jgi:hypothetical protein
MMKMTKLMKTTMSRTTKRKRHVENNLKKISKKIKMISRKKRSTCCLILNRLAIKMTSMWNRKEAKETLMKKTLMKKKSRRAVYLICSIRSTNFSILTRKKSRRLLRRFSDASLRSRRSIRNRHSIFDEVFDDRRKCRSKKKRSISSEENVESLLKRRRRSEFSSILLCCMIKLNNECVFFFENNEKFLFDFFSFLRSFVEFLKQIKRIHVLFCYLFIVFL